MEKIEKRESREWNKFVQNIRLGNLDFLRSKFGKELKKPDLEDFGLQTDQLSQVQADNERVEAHNRNQKTRRNKTAIYLSIGFIVVAFFITRNYLGTPTAIILLMFFGFYVFSGVGSLMEHLYPYREKSSAGKAFDSYQKKLGEYPEDEILKLKEEERILEIKRRERDYWFSLGGHEFEEEVSILFEKSGHFNVVKTKGSGDGGVDLILTTKNDGTKIIVQCKAHKVPVGPSIARDLYGAMHHEQASRGIIVSLCGVTQGVRDFIEGKNISIIDVDGLIKMNKMLLVKGGS